MTQSIERILTEFISENISLEFIFNDYTSKFLIFYLIGKLIICHDVQKLESDMSLDEWKGIRNFILETVYRLFTRQSHRYDSLGEFFRYYTQSIQSTIRENLPPPVDETNVQSIIQQYEQYRRLKNNPSLLMNIFSKVTQIDLEKKRIVDKLLRNHKKKFILFYLLSKIYALNGSLNPLQKDDFKLKPENWKKIQQQFFEYCTPKQIQRPLDSLLTKDREQSPSSIVQRFVDQNGRDDILRYLNEIRTDYRRLWYIQHLLTIETFPIISKQQRQQQQQQFKQQWKQQWKQLTLGDIIGEGNFGKVYKATTKKSGRVVAVKMPKDDHHFYSSLEDQFKKMKNIYGKIPEYVPRPYYYGLIEGRNSIVMQYLGPPWIMLEEYVRNPQNKSTPITLKIVDNLRSALRKLKQQNIRHGDLGTQNILVNPEDGSVKIIDWSFMTTNDQRPELFTEDDLRLGSLFFKTSR
jgi:hypothetical protein